MASHSEAIKIDKVVQEGIVSCGPVIAGSRVEVLFMDGKWYGGEAVRVSKSGWASIKFDYGEKFMIQLPNSAVRREAGGRRMGVVWKVEKHEQIVMDSQQSRVRSKRKERVLEICRHNIERRQCTDCKPKFLCEHNRPRSRCKACGGSEICEHNRVRSLCKPCKGSLICNHGRTRTACKDCKGGGICEHNRRRYTCRDCGGSGICEHNAYRSTCKICRGGGLCPHYRQRSRCKECGGSEICQHGRVRRSCRDCGGPHICKHKRMLYACVPCRGAGICVHDTLRSKCKVCRAGKGSEASHGRTVVSGRALIAGSRVEVLFMDGKWYGGGVEHVNMSGWASIIFDDGEKFAIQLPNSAVRREAGGRGMKGSGQDAEGGEKEEREEGKGRVPKRDGGRDGRRGTAGEKEGGSVWKVKRIEEDSGPAGEGVAGARKRTSVFERSEARMMGAALEASLAAY